MTDLSSDRVASMRPAPEFAVGQVWHIEDQPSVDWFVLSHDRIIALFAGGADHTYASFRHTYGDRVWLWSTATVYQTWCEQQADSLPLRWRVWIDLTYRVRPFDMLLDRRRWWFAQSGHQQSARWLRRHPEIVEAVRRD